MPTSDPAPPAVPTISSIMASISSNEAKLLALERRMTGGSERISPTDAVIDHLTNSTTAAVGGSNFPGRLDKRRRTEDASHGSYPLAINGAGASASASGGAVSPSNSRPPLCDITQFDNAVHAHQLSSLGVAQLMAAPLSSALADSNVTVQATAAVEALAMPQQQQQEQQEQPLHQQTLQQQQQQQGVAAQVSAVATAGVPAAGAGAITRARKRKQRDPRHEAAASGVAAGALARTALTSTPPGNGAAAAAAAGQAAASVSTPRRTHGSAGPAVPERGGSYTNQQATPPGLARHLFDDPGPAAVAAAAVGAGGCAVRSSGAAGGNGRTSAAVVPPPGSAAVTAPPSAQKRNIMSYYPPMLNHGLTAAVPPPFVLDQNSRDSLPSSLQHGYRQQPPPRPEVALGTAAAATAVADMVEDISIDGAGASASAELQSQQLRQLQQQVAQLQAQVMQVQAATAAQQAAAGAEIERLRTELQSRCLEVVSLQDKARAQEVALHQATAGEAAARAAMEALQAASAAETARWSAESLEAARVVSEREARYRGELARLVQFSARMERDLFRSQLSANSARLGTLTLARTGPMQMAEVWEEGVAFQQLAARRTALTAAKEEIVAAQKLLRKRLAPPPSGARGGAAAAAASAAASAAAAAAAVSSDESNPGAVHDIPPYMSGLEFVAADEVYKTRLAVLKREEEALRDEEERLSKEKLKQIRAVKLAREEDASRFGRWPVLPDRPGPEGRPRYVLMNLLGKGGFSEVFKAYDLVEARPVCVKIHALAPGWSSAKKESYVRHAIREYDIHRSLRHPAVVALLDVLEIDLDTFATVLELCEGGDLDGLLREHRTLPEREARCLMAQIFSGLRYLAARRVIHYDLKPANILFDSLGQAKITDFGLSKQISEGQTLAGIELTSQGAGTYWYLPPEAFETGGPAPPRISNKLDVWSAGIIFYSILYGKKPYGEAMSQEQMLRERVMAVPREVDFPSRPAVSSEAKDFIRRCLSWSQDNRPDVEAAATDPYLTGITTTAAGTAATGSSAGASAATAGGSAVAASAASVGGVLSMGLAAMVSGGGIGSRR